MLRSARFVVFVSLSFFAVASPSLGASPRGEGRKIRALAVHEWTAQTLGRLYAFLERPRWMKAGLSPDPSGACSTGPAPSCGQQQQSGEAGLIAGASGGT